MTFRLPAVTAVCIVLGLAAEHTVTAQPIAPPPRPTFSGYGSFFRPGYGYYGYGGGGPGYGGFGYGGPGFGYGGGFGGPGFGGLGFGGLGFGGFGAGGLLQQNLMLQQMATTTQNMATLQTLSATGVNPNFRVTGVGAVYNYLGHWYPTSRYGGMGGGMGLGMGGLGTTAAPRSTGTSGAAGGAGGAGGNNAGRTAGSGIPIGGPQPRR